MSPRARLTIDAGAIADNWRLLERRARPAECGAAVKADAYGLGVDVVVPALLRAGCGTFFVAQLDEGARVRAAAGPEAVVYVLNGAGDMGAWAEFAGHDLRPVLNEAADVVAWGAACARHGRVVAIAAQVDTGMNRLGAPMRDLDAMVAAAAAPGVAVALVMSHFAQAEVEGSPATPAQVERFGEVARRFPAVRLSLANSSGLFLPSALAQGLARPGYALYGGNPTPGRGDPMRPVVRLEAPILQLRDVAAGEAVGYGGRWTAPRPTRLATIGIGYADGLPRSAGGADGAPGADVVVDGRRCPLVGTVSMDLAIVDVTRARVDLAPGAMVEVLGPTIGIDELATRSGTIGYEILTRLGRRFERRVVGA